MSEAWNAYQATMARPPSLWSAVRANDPAEIVRLLDAGDAVDARDARGYSPLMLAAYLGHAEAFEVLLDRGADPNSSDASGNSVLMGASFKGHVAMVRRLVTAGADLHARNAAGLDALGFATSFGRTEVAALLHELQGAS